MKDTGKFIKPEYPSYNGLARTALIMGAFPLVPTVLICIAAILIALILQAFIGPAGLLFVLLAVPVLFFLKSVCETDDRAMSILWLEIKTWSKRANTRFWNNTYTLTPIKYGHHHHVYKRFFENSTIY